MWEMIHRVWARRHRRDILPLLGPAPFPPYGRLWRTAWMPRNAVYFPDRRRIPAAFRPCVWQWNPRGEVYNRVRPLPDQSGRSSSRINPT